jgi:hypothetical protein
VYKTIAEAKASAAVMHAKKVSRYLLRRELSGGTPVTSALIYHHIIDELRGISTRT